MAVLFLLWGCMMTLGQEIERLRSEKNIPICVICNSLAISSEFEYDKIVRNHIRPNIYQMIMLTDLFQCPIKCTK